MEVIGRASGDAFGLVEDQAGPPPAGTRRAWRRRRPTGEPPPLPRHLQTTGLGWLLAAVALNLGTAGQQTGSNHRLEGSEGTRRNRYGS
jgi:hypothetical protein